MIVIFEKIVAYLFDTRRAGLIAVTERGSVLFCQTVTARFPDYLENHAHVAEGDDEQWEHIGNEHGVDCHGLFREDLGVGKFAYAVVQKPDSLVLCWRMGVDRIFWIGNLDVIEEVGYVENERSYGIKYKQRD